MYYVIGLGNPGEEYENTRHNVGKMALDVLWEKNDFEEWRQDKKMQRSVAKGEIADNATTLIFPEAYMNKSGLIAKQFVTSVKKAEKTIVIYDDIDLPLGTIKISFGRGSGGHRGIESIIKQIKTKDFVRVRVGVTPTTPTGKLKKPKGEQKVLDFLMGDFKKPEKTELKKILKDVNDAVECIMVHGREIAMTDFN